MFVLNTHVQRSRRYGFLASNACQHKPILLCQGQSNWSPIASGSRGTTFSLLLRLRSSEMLQEQTPEVKANSSKVAGFKCIWPESATKASPNKIQLSDAYSFCLKKQSCVD